MRNVVSQFTQQRRLGPGRAESRALEFRAPPARSMPRHRAEYSPFTAIVPPVYFGAQPLRLRAAQVKRLDARLRCFPSNRAPPARLFGARIRLWFPARRQRAERSLAIVRENAAVFDRPKELFSVRPA